MKAELSQVENIETQVREAITLKELPNSILQSSANEENVHPVGAVADNSETVSIESGTMNQNSGMVEAKNNNTAVNGVIDESRVIDLSNDNELAQLLGDIHGAEKYKKIKNYILGLLGGKSIKLSDGKNAVVDGRDAKHIARNAGNKKTAQIAQLKKLIENGKLVAEETSTKENKFEYFYYYEAYVKYENETFPVYLNVGKARNDGSYHIYDITQKIRDTAHRVNDVGRPVGNALENGVSNDIIDERTSDVNSSISDNGENYSDNDSREPGFREADTKEIYRKSTEKDFDILTGKRKNAAQRQMEAVAEKFGVKVGYKDDITKGYYDPALKAIYMNPVWSLTEQYFVLFKHELTHHLENYKAYDSFKFYVVNYSNSFDAYVRDRLKDELGEEFKGSRKEALKAYNDIVLKQRQASKEIPDRIKKSYNPESIEREIAADFVGEVMLGGKDAAKAEAALMEIAKTEHRTLLEKIRDWVKEWVSIIKGEPQNRTLAEDLEYLNRRIARVLDSKEIEKSTTQSGGVKFSFEGYAEDGKGKYKSNFPQGTPKKAKGERILKYIQEIWSKKTIRLKINEDGAIRYIEAKFDPTYDETKNVFNDATKLMGGNRHGTSSEQRVTLDLADDYYQIASESSYNYSKDEIGKNSLAHNDVKNGIILLMTFILQNMKVKNTLRIE